LYLVTRKPGLPAGYSMRDMAADYAHTIREEIQGPVDVIGTSTGGSIAQHFAADHPDLVRRLILHSTAHTLGDAGKEVQLRIGRLAGQRRWRAAYAAMLGFLMPRSGIKGLLGKLAAGIGSFLMSLMPPKDPADLVITVEAEDRHAFKDRLAEIAAPTL